MSPIILQNTLILNPTGGPDILTSIIPNGTQGTFYTFTMTAGGGTLPYVWSLASGTLDSGVTLSAAGVISGTPANAETDNITIRVTDAIGRFITKSFNITFAPAANPLVITTSSPLPGGNEFNVYSTALSATGGTPPYVWGIISGTFPTGVSIAPTTGVISGTPTSSGTSNFTIQVQDSLNVTTSKAFALTISPPAPLVITTGSTLPIGTTGTFYSTTLAATGGIQPYTWTILSGTLQTGLTLSSTGTISGTPTVASTNSVTIQVQDNVGTVTSKTFSLAVFAPLVLNGATLPNANPNVAYSQDISGNASGGKTPYTFSKVSTTGADTWAVSSAGVISGTPGGATNDTVTVQVQDSNGNTAQAIYTINVNSVIVTPYKFNPGDYAMTVQYQHNVTLAFAQTDIDTLAANQVPGGATKQGYVMGANWAAVETGAQVDNPTFSQSILNTQYPGFAVWEQIFNYLQSKIPGAHMGISVMGNQYGKHFPSSVYTTANWGSGQFIPSYIATCGGSLTVPNGYGASTHTTYPVAPLYSGSSFYGFALDALNTGASPQEFTAFVPAFWNPGVNQAFINFIQAASHYVFQSGPFAGSTFDSCPLIEFFLFNDEWSYGLNQNPTGGQAINPPNFTNSANQPTRANAEAAYELLFRSAAATFPHTMVATNTSFTFGTVQTPAQTAAMVNNNISGTGVSLSTIKGVALCAADTFGTDWTSAGGANYAKQGYVGVTSPAFGSTIVATSKTLAGVMPIFAQVQPSDYNIHLPSGTTSYTAGAVQALTASADNSYIQCTHRIWCMADDRFLTNQGAWTGYVQPALVAGTGIAPFSLLEPVSLNLSKSLSVSTTTFVNQNAVVPSLKGVNNSGLELCGPFGEHPWGGNPPSYALMNQWGINISRFPLNSASWLGLTTWSTSGSAFGAQNNVGVGNGTMDPFGDYKAAVFATIDSCRNNGIYPLFDLHWGSNRITIGGVTHDVSYQGQLAFMDTTGFTFWCDPTVGFVAALATRYGSPGFNALHGFNGGLAGAFYNSAFGGASGFGDVIFELFNEPFMGHAGETYAAGSADLALINGGIVNKYVTNFGPPNITTNVTLAGYQQIVTGIRALGATNIIIVNGNQYSQNLQNFQTWRPIDPVNQIGFGNHPYPINSYPYSGSPNFQFPLVGDDSGGPPGWHNNVTAIQTAGYPVMITEDGGDGGTSATQGEPHITYTTGFAASNNIPFMAWTFGGQDFYQAVNTASSLNTLLRHDTTGTKLWPMQGYGWIYYFFTSGNSLPTITTASPLPNGNQSSSYSTTLAASGGAGVPFVWSLISDTGSGLSLSSGGVLSGTLTGTTGTYTITVQAIDQFGIQTAQKAFSLTVQVNQNPGLPQNLVLTNQSVNSQSIAWGAATQGANPINHYKIYRNGVALSTTTGLSFTDSTATNSQQNNTFAPSTVYAYSVSAVDSLGNEGGIQTQCTFWMYQNGVANQGQQDFSFNASPNWADNTGAPPVGTLCISFNFIANNSSGFQPCTNSPMSTEDFGGELGAFNFFNIDIKLTDGTHTFFLSHLSRPGYPGGTDYFAWAQAPNFLSNLSSNYGTPTVGSWFTLKVPLSVLSIGVSQFHGYISGNTLTMTHLDSGPGPDDAGYITGPGVAAGTFINQTSGTPPQSGPFPVSVSQTVGSAANPVALTCTRNNMYKLSFGMNSFPAGTKVYMNNLRWTVS